MAGTCLVTSISSFKLFYLFYFIFNCDALTGVAGWGARVSWRAPEPPAVTAPAGMGPRCRSFNAPWLSSTKGSGAWRTWCLGWLTAHRAGSLDRIQSRGSMCSLDHLIAKGVSDSPPPPGEGTDSFFGVSDRFWLQNPPGGLLGMAESRPFGLKSPPNFENSPKFIDFQPLLAE